MKMTIKVEQWDIDNANKYKQDKSTWMASALCPVALAAKRTFRNNNITMAYSRLCSYKTRSLIPVPQKTTQFIRDFDDGKPVEPFSFEVEY